ncbi:MAG: TrkA C-terminal domain-containing protein, partial [Clostridia bacterium]|nr:TrkA C-terminal domain-containing protein [Clostridia bacterium]
PWCGKKVSQLGLRHNTLIVMVIRNGEKLIPDGKTILMKDDTVVLFGETDN